MLNLLPQAEKTQQIRDYKIRFWTMCALFACALLVVAIVGLSPTYLSMRGEMQILLDQKKEVDQQNSQASVEEADRLAAGNVVAAGIIEARIGELKQRYPTTSIVSKVFAKKPDTITLGSIQVSGKEVVLRGIAATRADLIAFNSALREDALFANSTLPIGDIAKSTQAEFTINILLP